jgi:hypothetical protein
MEYGTESVLGTDGSAATAAKAGQSTTHAVVLSCSSMRDRMALAADSVGALLGAGAAGAGPRELPKHVASAWLHISFQSSGSRREGGSAGTLLLMMVMVACVRAWWDQVRVRGRCIWRRWARRTSGRHCRSGRREWRLDRRCDQRYGGSRLGRDPFSAGWARHSDGGGSGGKLGVCSGDFTA